MTSMHDICRLLSTTRQSPSSTEIGYSTKNFSSDQMRTQYLFNQLRSLSSPLHRPTAALKQATPLQSRSYHHHFTRPLFPFSRRTLYKAAPTIPFMGTLFSSSAKAENNDDMSYPDTRSDDQWRAVLSPGMSLLPNLLSSIMSNKPSIDHSQLIVNRAIQNPPPKRHRSPLHGRIRQTPPLARRLHLRGLQRPTLQSVAQVQVRLRLASVF